MDAPLSEFWLLLVTVPAATLVRVAQQDVPDDRSAFGNQHIGGAVVIRGSIVGGIEDRRAGGRRDGRAVGDVDLVCIARGHDDARTVARPAGDIGADIDGHGS